MKRTDLDVVHILGKNVAGRTSGIIVRFVCRRARDEVIANRRKLTKRPNQARSVIITEDLTQ